MGVKFFLEFVKNPIELSTIFPTSKTTGKRMAEAAGVKKAKTIVEIGAAHGNVTREILKIMPTSSTLYAVEINKQLYKDLCKIKDKRLVTINGNAKNLKQLLKKHSITSADCIVSTIPFATMPKDAEKIVANIKEIIKGPLVQIQYSKVLDKFFKRNFRKVEITFCLQNIPPAFIYTCRR